LKRWREGFEAVILLYHRVSPGDVPWLFEVAPVSPEAFEAQLQYLCSHYEVISLDDLVQNVFDDKRSGRRIASITFDDGYKDNFSYAFPLLRKYRAPATIFLTTGSIELPDLLWWDKIGYVLTYARNDRLSLGEFGDYRLRHAAQRRAIAHEIISRLETIPEERKNKLVEDTICESGVEISDELAEETMMTWQDICTLHKEGICFGAHSVSHPILTNMPIEGAVSEIRESKSQIEKRVGQTVDFFAYPNGEFNDAIAKTVEDSGFSAAVTAEPVWITPAASRFKLGRTGLFWDDLNTFRVVLSGIRGDLRQLRKVKH
jgi:peptidoglycan/xylan/chitin deacetylase (PgdA/CDA1 family)